MHAETQIRRGIDEISIRKKRSLTCETKLYCSVRVTSGPAWNTFGDAFAARAIDLACQRVSEQMTLRKQSQTVCMRQEQSSVLQNHEALVVS